MKTRDADPLLRNEVLSTWTTEQGLPQNFVTALAQTPDGFLWVGTLNGLARFDGLHFSSVVYFLVMVYFLVWWFTF